MNRICRDSISSLMWISWKSESKSVASFKLISCCIFNWKFAGWNPYFSKVCWTFFTLRCSFQISKVDRGVATEASLILCIDAQSLKLKGMTPMIDILVPVAWQEIYLSTIQIYTFGLPYAHHYNPLLIRNRSWILTIHKAKAQCVELKLRWQFCVHTSTCHEIYF